MAELDAAIDRFRAAVIRQDAIARQRLIQAYADALRRLRPLIELVELELLALDDVSPWRIFQLERWRILETQLYEEIAAIGRIENLHLTESQRRLVAMAGEHSRALALVQVAPADVARIAQGWVQVSPYAVESLIGATVDGAPLQRLFDAIGPDVANMARRMLSDAIALGQHPRIVANALTAATDQAFARTYTIARTEMLRAYRTAAIRTYQENTDILDGWIWVAAKSARSCAACLALDGQVFPLEERFMRQHVNCFIAGTQVSGPKPLAGSKRWYAGDIVKIGFASGDFLTVTPNHPILATHGWVAAGLLREGDKVISNSLTERELATVYPDNQRQPTLIEDIPKTLGDDGAVTSVSVPSTAKDFHGDGMDANVDVVRADSLLRDGTYAALTEPTGQSQFVSRNMILQSLIGHSTLAFLIPGMFAATDGIMCRRHHALAFLCGSLRHANAHRLASTSRRHAGTFEMTQDGGTRNTVFSSKRFDGFSGQMPVSDLSAWQRREFHISHSDAMLAQEFRDALRSATIGAADTQSRFAGQVTTNDVISVQRERFSGHVYNLETKDGWYIANGIIVHNCRCSASPSVSGVPWQRETGSEWLAKQPADVQDEVLGKRGGEAYRAGEVDLGDFVRVDVSSVWGPSYRDGGVQWARQNAFRRAA